MTSYSTDYSRFKDIVDSDEEKDSEHEAEEAGADDAASASGSDSDSLPDMLEDDDDEAAVHAAAAQWCPPTVSAAARAAMTAAAGRSSPVDGPRAPAAPAAPAPAPAASAAPAPSPAPAAPAAPAAASIKDMKATIKRAGLATADLLVRSQVDERYQQVLARLAEAQGAPGGRHSTDYSRFDGVASDCGTDDEMPGLDDPDAAAEESDSSDASGSSDDAMPTLEDQEEPEKQEAPAATDCGDCAGCESCAWRAQKRAEQKARSEAQKREKAKKAGARQRELNRRADEKRQRDRKAMKVRKAAEREHEAERERRSREARETREAEAEAERARKLEAAERKRDAAAAREAADRAVDALRAVGTCRSCSSTIIHSANRISIKCSEGCRAAYLAKCWEISIAPDIADAGDAYRCPTGGCAGHLVAIERTTCKGGKVEAVREEVCKAPPVQKAEEKKPPAAKRPRADSLPRPLPEASKALPADATASIWVGPITDGAFERCVEKAVRTTNLSAEALEGISRSTPPLGFLEKGPPEFVPGFIPRPFARVRCSTINAAQIVARALEGHLSASVRVLNDGELDAVVALETVERALVELRKHDARQVVLKEEALARAKITAHRKLIALQKAREREEKAASQQKMRAAVAAAPFPAPAAWLDLASGRRARGGGAGHDRGPVLPHHARVVRRPRGPGRRRAHVRAPRDRGVAAAGQSDEPAHKSGADTRRSAAEPRRAGRGPRLPRGARPQRLGRRAPARGRAAAAARRAAGRRHGAARAGARGRRLRP